MSGSQSSSRAIRAAERRQRAVGSPRSTAGLTSQEIAALNTTLEWCSKNKGQSSAHVEVAGYDLMLRYSRPEWPVANTNLTYTTIDVVQIGHHDFMSSVDGNLSVIPKNGAKPVWEFLEAYCREKGVALRVEGVNNDQLRRKLIARRGFENEGYYNSTSIIKTLGAPGTAHDQMFHNKVDAL